MSPRKSERIMNLAICLLLARRFVEKSHIRDVVEGYAGLSDVAFERTFERDKDELRAMGVPVETGSDNPLFPDEVGYRIRREEFELPPIEFTASETMVLGLATRVWESATQADQALSALAKLRAAGVEPDPGRLEGLSASVTAKEPAFEALWQATVAHVPVSFGYRGEKRQVEPWAMSYRRGAWYLVGFDRVRQASRVFKVARVDTDVTSIGRRDSFEAPTVDVDSLLFSLEPAAPDAEALLAIRGDRAPGLRRRGRRVESPVTLPPGFSAYQVTYARRGDLVGDVCAGGPDVLVLEPFGVRAAVLKQLAGIAGGS
ncbi:MAG: WYL domain-containing protein [Propionicimonas sp.]